MFPSQSPPSQGSDREEEDFEDDERLEERRSLHQLDLSGMAWHRPGAWMGLDVAGADLRSFFSS